VQALGGKAALCARRRKLSIFTSKDLLLSGSPSIFTGKDLILLLAMEQDCNSASGRRMTSPGWI
jgi:hypothetical protein